MHKHHLKPKHLGGTNDPSNLLEVTEEEHALIHEARWYAYRQWQDKLAWQILDHLITGEQGRREAQRLAVVESNKTRKRKPFNHTEETKKKISKTKTGVSVPKPEGWGQRRSELMKAKRKEEVRT